MEQDAPLAEPVDVEPTWSDTQLLEYTHDAIIIWEMQGQGILYWNRAAEQLYGYSRIEARGRATHELLKTELVGGVTHLENSLARFGIWAGELHHTTRSGDRVDVEGRLAVMSQRNGRWLVLEVNRDITDKKAAETARRAMEHQLAELMALQSTSRQPQGTSATLSDGTLDSVLPVSRNAQIGMREAQGQGLAEAEVLIDYAAAAQRRNPLARLLTDREYALRALRFALNLPTRMETEDRRVLEETIFPYYRSLPDIRSVLFVGCDWYTQHYGREFFRTCDYWTMDVDRRARKYGAKHHIVDSIEWLDQHFDIERFDLIVCNGVFGFGLNGTEECERAFRTCYTRLKSGGHFLLGWTDVPSRVPVPLESIERLKRFQPFIFPPLGASRYVTATPYHHTYDFYRKNAAV